MILPTVMYTSLLPPSPLTSFPYASLSPRERQVMALVFSGLLNKQIGGELGISEITVKAHRGQVMQKMHANSFADLIKMSAKLGLSRMNDFPRLRGDHSRAPSPAYFSMLLGPRRRAE